MDKEIDDEFDSVVGTRYLAPELSPIWSKKNRVLIMRKLWLALVKVQKKMGLNDISDEGIEEMTQQLNHIDLVRIDEYETDVEYDMIQDMERFIQEKEIERGIQFAKEIEKKRKEGCSEEEIQIEIEKELKLKEERQQEIQEIREMREKDLLEKEKELQERRAEREKEKEENGEQGEKGEHPDQDKVIRNVSKEVYMNLKAYEDLCPKAKGFIHKGATTNYISENCDIIVMKKSLNILISKLFLFINYMMKRSHEFIDTALLAHTNYHKTHIITLGKRIAMWNSDLMDLFDKWAKISFPFRGIKGDMPGPGSESASEAFKLFNGDVKLCNKLNTELAREFDFSPNKVMIASGKSQMRAFNIHMVHLITILSQTIFKIMNDVRLLVSQDEVTEGALDEADEGAGKGSSALEKSSTFLAPKGAEGCSAIEKSSTPSHIIPMTTERICSLTRYVIAQEFGMNQTYIHHWLDHSMDDTPIKRIVLPEVFLLTEHIIDCSYIIFNKLIFNDDIIRENVMDFIHHIVQEEFVLRGEEVGIPRKEIEERLKKVIVEYETAEAEREKKEKLDSEADKEFDMDKESFAGFTRMRTSLASIEKYDIDIKKRQERAKSYFRSDPLLYKLIDQPPIGLNLISLDSKDFIGSAPIQVFQLNHFFSNKTSSLFWIK
jgi:adenylosuccinate lyase